jgi:hypothetical protein
VGSSTGGVDPAVVESCAGFSVETAAELLGVAPATLSDESGRSDNSDKMCRYWSHESLIGPGLQFLLEVERSAAAAAARLRRLREEAPGGDAAIGTAVRQDRGGRSVMTFDGIGDEAFWDPLTGGVNLRVGNVLASIQASAQRKVVSNSDPVQVELERRVAERIARGLTTRSLRSSLASSTTTARFPPKARVAEGTGTSRAAAGTADPRSLHAALDPRVQRWQRRWEPIHRRVFEGLLLTRDIPSQIVAGFQMERLERV